MCSRYEKRLAQKAQDTAAEALTHACNSHLCSDDIGKALSKVWPLEPVPERFNELLRELK